MRTFILGVGLFGLCLFPALAATYVIAPDGSGDYPTIQAAVNVAGDADIIELTDGIFTGDGNRDIVIEAIVLTLRSQGGPGVCAIDCETYPGGPQHGAFDVQNCPLVLIEGITIRNGYRDYGSALAAHTANSNILNCIFEDCFAAHSGGALYLDSEQHEVEGCGFYACEAGTAGGGLCAFMAEVSTLDCCFARNEAPDGGAIATEGGPLYVTGCTFTDHPGSVTMIRTDSHWVSFRESTFYANEGIAVSKDMDATIRFYNTIIAFGGSVAIDLTAGATAELECCDIYGNAGGDWTGLIAGQLGINGNICADPLFCDPASGDLRLHENSPCAPGSECDLIGAWPVGCGQTPVSSSTWGEIKAMFW